MKAGSLISMDEYLHTSYHPDCDYVDGEVIERNVGEKDHGKVQRNLILYFGTRVDQWNAHVFPEQRVQVAPSRFRVPDVCVVVGEEPAEQIFYEPPFICVEVLSKDDTLNAMQERIDDYLNFGVPYVWVINPWNRRAWAYTRNEIKEVKDGTLRTENPSFEIPLNALF